jgi:phage-related protein (TIGR01555 family)
MSANRMLEALAKQRGLRLVEDPTLVIGLGESARFDAWENSQTGLGTTRDKTYYNVFSPARTLMDGELSALYHGDDLAARMVDVVPDEMLREGFQLDLGDAVMSGEVLDQLEALGAPEKLADGIRWGRLFGGGGVILGVDDGQPASSPLNAEKAKALNYLYPFDRRYLWPLTYYRDSGNPKLGQPETYMVTSATSHVDIPVAVVHETRLITFGGATTGIREREVNQGWDLSVLQRPHDVLGNFNMGWQAVSFLLQDANNAVFKMSGLADAIAEGQGEALRNRFLQMDMARSVVRATVVDAGDGTPNGPPESYERQVFPMTGIPDTLDKLCLRLAAAVQIPVTILMGQSPAGMNATGESDFRWFYDRIRSDQMRKLAPRIRRIVRVMLKTKIVGREVDAIKVKFPPLWTEAPQAAATTRKIILEGDAVAINAGVLLPEEGAKRFQGEGFGGELTLSPEGIKAREDALKGEFSTGDTETDAAATAGGESIQQQVLNGAQIASLVDVVAQVAAGTLPRASGVQILVTALQVSAKDAEKLMGPAGTPGFEPPPAPAPAGGFGFPGKGGPPAAKPDQPKPTEADETELEPTT